MISIFIIIALIAVTIGAYTDIKTLEVPDWLNYALIATGIAGNLIYWIFYSDSGYIIRCVLGLGLSLIIGLLMYYTGQWGGGDSKMLFGLGALLGLEYDSFGLFSKFLINMIFAGALYGMVFIAVMAFKNKKKILQNLKKQRQTHRLYIGIIAIVALIIINFLSITPELKILLCLLILIMYFMNYLLIFVRVVEKVSMVKNIDPEKLTEGDWIVDEIKIDGKYITGPKDLGIEKKKIEQLIKFKQEGKINKIKVKYGIPFVPSFFIALVYTVITEKSVFGYFIFY